MLIRATAFRIPHPATRRPYEPTRDGDESGRLFLLHSDANGALVRSTGFTNEYFITPVQNQDHWTGYQSTGNTGFIPRDASFSKSGSTLRWDRGDSGGEDVYVRTSAKVTGPLTGQPTARLGAAGCTLPEAGVHGAFHSQADLSAAIVGKWIACGAPYLPATNGIEFTADGHFYALSIDANGTATRSSDPTLYGTIAYSDGADWDGQGAWQFTLQAVSGLWGSSVAVAEAPVKLQLSDDRQAASTYSALP